MVSYRRCAPALTPVVARPSYSQRMPSDATPPASDQPVAGISTSGGDTHASASDDTLMGYESALPWLQPAWLGHEAARPAWLGSTPP
jgi:hypothetical protein